MVRYFQLDRMLSQQYDEVWRWIDWPGRDGKPDTGIDMVARERDTGAYTAVQCKFYEPTHTLAKGDIDSFFTASGKKPFTNRVIISTTDWWCRNAEDALEDQTTPVQRIGLAEIAESPIDWDISWPAGELHVELSEAKRHYPRLHQQAYKSSRVALASNLERMITVYNRAMPTDTGCDPQTTTGPSSNQLEPRMAKAGREGNPAGLRS